MYNVVVTHLLYHIYNIYILLIFLYFVGNITLHLILYIC